MSGGFNVTRTLENPTGIGTNYTNYNWGGQIVTDPTANNTKGAWYQLTTNGTFSNTTSDTSAMMLFITYGNTNSTTDFSGQADIAIGPSGSQQIIISNLNFNGGPSGATYACNFVTLVLPLCIPNNTPLWARWAANATAPVGTMVMNASLWDSSFMSNPIVYKFDTLGSNNTVIGQGTAIPLGAQTKGAYVQIGTASNDYKGFFVMFDWYQLAASAFCFNIDIAIGTGGSQQIIVPDIVYYQEQQIGNTPYFDIPIPSGTAIWARGLTSASSANTVGLTFYGGY